MFWNQSKESAEVQTTWEEISTYHRYWLKSVTCSEIDCAERGPICYASDRIRRDTDDEDDENEQENEDPKNFGPGLTFVPIIFQSLFYIHTRKGSILRVHQFSSDPFRIRMFPHARLINTSWIPLVTSLKLVIFFSFSKFLSSILIRKFLAR